MLRLFFSLTLSLLFLSSFQIQSRLQNLGSNLQNKSNDIEVLAVSPLFIYPLLSCFCFFLFCFPALPPYLLNSCVKSQKDEKKLRIAKTTNIMRSCPFYEVLALSSDPLLVVRWLACEYFPVAAEQWALNRRQRPCHCGVGSGWGVVNGCHIVFICGWVADSWTDSLEVNLPACLNYTVALYFKCYVRVVWIWTWCETDQ